MDYKCMYDSMKVEQPEDLITEDPHAVAETILKNNPSARIISWNTEMLKLWDWLSDNYDTKGIFPPPLKIDKRKHPPMNINPETGQEILVNAQLNGTWRHLLERDEEPRIISLSSYECRIYENNFRRTIKNYWKNHIPLVVLKLLIQHTLLHECCHYLMAHNIWYELYNEHGVVPYDTAVDNVIAYMKNSGSTDDEMRTEAMTLQMLRDRYLTNPGTGLTIIPGGHFDQVMRQKDPDCYAMVSSMIEFLTLDFKSCFDDIDDSTISAYELRMLEITKAHRSYAKKNPIKWNLIG